MTSEEPSDLLKMPMNRRHEEDRSLLVRRYEELVGPHGARKARSNHHCKRRPIQCGLTIHPGNDCAYSCLYCYIADMGFKFCRPVRCELTAEELVLSLLYNRNFASGRNGTYIAIGSIVEPFQPELKSLTLEYIELLATLGNPIQFSTKSHLTKSDAKAIADSCNWISPLVTILTLDESKTKMLEPLAPSPRERLDTIANLAEAGVKPFLFLRPILPGVVTIEENMKVIDEATRRGSQGVVLGDFRVTERIAHAMKAKGFDVSDIERRAKVIDSRQRSVPVWDLRNKISELVGRATNVYMRSCCASAYCAGLKQCAHELAAPRQSQRAA